MTKTSLKKKSQKKENIKLNSKDEKPDNLTSEYKPIKAHSFTDVRGWFTQLKDKFVPQKTFLVHMEMINGLHSQFIVFVDDDTFKYGGANYIIDHSIKYFDVSAGLWCLDYHQGFSLPIKRMYNIEKLRKVMKQGGVSNVEEAINPRTLSQFIRSKVIEMLMQGGEMDSFFRFIKLMVIITAVASVVHLLMFMQQTGMLASLTGSLGI